MNRYGHFKIHEIWSRDSQMKYWAVVEKDAMTLAGAPVEVLEALPPAPTGDVVDGLEQVSGGHEMVAFLTAWLKGLPEKVTCWVHRGLTTSDVTDTATSLQMSATVNVLMDQVGEVCYKATSKTSPADPPRLGRTHGQPAGKTRLSHQMKVRTDALQRSRTRMSNFRPDAMFSGPLGLNYDMKPLNGLRHTSQAMPRDLWSEWVDALVATVSAMEDLAWFLWSGIRDEEFLLTEGSTSSSMPHKVNPTRLERVAGMARLARGYRAALAECLVMRDDRDLAHSSVERVALPGLAVCVSQAALDLVAVLRVLDFDYGLMEARARSAPDSHETMVSLMEEGVGYFEARRVVEGD